jgi:hypothetical protein
VSDKWMTPATPMHRVPEKHTIVEQRESRFYEK